MPMPRVYFGAVAGSAGADVGPIPGIVGPRNGNTGAGALEGVDALGKLKFGNGDSGVFNNPGKLGKPLGSEAAGLGLLASSINHFWYAAASCGASRRSSCVLIRSS